MSASAIAPLGCSGIIAPRVGLGAMGATSFYASDPAAARADALAALAAYARSVAPAPAFVDTAALYAHPSGAHNEELVGAALAADGAGGAGATAAARARWVVATKFGINPDFSVDSSDAAIRASLAASLSRLGVAHVDLLYQHRADPATPVEAVARTVASLIAAGTVRAWGLSECTPAELRRAHAVCPVAAVQLEWSLHTRDAEAALVPACRELGVAIVAYSPLGRGLLAGKFAARADLADGDWRLKAPRFAEERLAANAAGAAALAAAAARHGCTPAQLALAWLLRRGGDVFVIPGSKVPARAAENCGAAAVAARLTDADVAAVGEAVPEATGDRYEGMHGTFNTRL
jgi:aryl-alcohol dehydrogenase-like predicted oxidoreductase